MLARRSRPAHTPGPGCSFALACLVSAAMLLATSCGKTAPRAASEPVEEISQREQAIAEFLAALNDLQWLELADITTVSTFEEFVGRGTDGLLVGALSGRSTVTTEVDPSFPWDEELKATAGSSGPVRRSVLRLGLSSSSSKCKNVPSDLSVLIDYGMGDTIGTRELDAHPILKDATPLEGVQVLIPLRDCAVPGASAPTMILAPAPDSKAVAGSEPIDLQGASFATVVSNAQNYWTTSVEHRFNG